MRSARPLGAARPGVEPVARRVFFSFHYERDVWRSSVVRNSWMTKSDREDAGFFDASIWEEAKTKGKAAVEALIDDALVGSSVTAVLIGAETADRPYVQYEISKSYGKKGLLGIYIHNIENSQGLKDTKGANPFSRLKITRDGKDILLSELFPTYDWVNDDGYTNLGTWVEAAYTAANP